MQHISALSNVKVEKRVISERPRLLSLYAEPPQQELTLDEFEVVSLDRLQLLRSIDVLKTKGGTEGEHAFNHQLYELEKKYLLSNREFSHRMNEVERDQVSHFILRLAYCRTEELRRWFLGQECSLMKYRLDSLSDEERASFMLSNGMDFDPVSNEEKNSRKDKLIDLAGVTSVSIIKTTFYKVPFQQALSLVSSRSVYLEKGFAYVPLQRLVSIIVTRFRMQLSRALAEAANSFDIVGSDHRIGPLLKNMNKQFIGNDFTKTNQSIDKLSPDKIELAAEVNMPLCMKNLHSNLKREHKLKHWGRLQYGLFLKGAGLDLEGAQQFWESHFTKLISHDQFVKSYAYSFRHMYGKEGARKNYTPYSCMKIIMGTPPETGAFHGCPYRHMPDNQLSSLLSSLKLSAPDVTEIAALAKSSNYQIACQRHFDVTHPGHLNNPELKSDAVANHPNLWFQTSVNYHKLKNGKPINTVSPSSGTGANDSNSASTTAVGEAVKEEAGTEGMKMET
uniref:DNA primase large subunit n=1 Tax=Spumella elongata TaxID=89044 RepID=A0A7S3H1X7_9STRA|mmetsp:Transcript_30904/g.52963  ORF Transcript_30904/g.52963 Transcript_30904/m.52963 type:complete len:506 (+) Transcript_30904:59-1576(+)|eukprot:CAMPEP_0184989956 /NCGR_PEP_ID=MMETSP1098-20130426/30588_1 /TAXON_ID=89044 /ORGANISM="Spumella elongata, Strain CCAP 955/1" /LENGTH=505 /DNA_ID=CAMNT_0027515071 /DNA_START=59 /DNA_END=1576 /DNA_ORIENTATION=+